jgi:predicted nicotinamide N-methyase
MSGDPGPPAEAVPEIIREGTRLGPVPLVPEIRLWQASEPMALWRRTEQAASQAGRTPGQAAEGAGQAGLDPPFWAFAWAGGQALARYLLDHPQTVRGRRVIDVASGSGLVAIAAALAGAAGVTGYDIAPPAAVALEVNAAANDVTVTAECADVLDGDGVPAPGADVVLVADAFYQRDLAARVMRFLDRVQAGGAAVLVGDFGRTYLPKDLLTPVASYDVPGLQALEDSDIKRTTVWTLAGPHVQGTRH